MRAVADRITRTWWAVTIVIVALAGALAVVGVVGEATRTPTTVDSLPIGSDSAKALVESDRPIGLDLFDEGAEGRAHDPAANEDDI